MTQTNDGGATDLTTDALKRLAARLLLEAPHVEGWEDEDGDPVPFADDIRAAVSAIRELIERREADGWQPIETAPLDKDILVYRPTLFTNGYIGIARWCTDKYAKRPKPFWASVEAWIGKINERAHPPTHWQPLPEAPTTEGGQQ